MKVLCLSTAFKEAQVIVFDGEKQFCKVLESSAKSSENVLPMIEEMLGLANVKINEIDVIGVVSGPGSFTGLRVGAALMKGFCAVFPHIKVVAVNSLELMGYEWQKNSGNCGDFCVIQNALGGRFFVKCYQNGRFGDDALVRELPEMKKIGLNLENLSEADGYVVLTPKALLDFVLSKIEQQEFVSAESFEPVYLRLSQAEENLLTKEKIDAEN